MYTLLLYFALLYLYYGFLINSHDRFTQSVSFFFSLALAQPLDCPRASKVWLGDMSIIGFVLKHKHTQQSAHSVRKMPANGVSLKDMGKHDRRLTITKHSKGQTQPWVYFLWYTVYTWFICTILQCWHGSLSKSWTHNRYWYLVLSSKLWRVYFELCGKYNC